MNTIYRNDLKYRTLTDATEFIIARYTSFNLQHMGLATNCKLIASFRVILS